MLIRTCDAFRCCSQLLLQAPRDSSHHSISLCVATTTPTAAPITSAPTTTPLPSQLLHVGIALHQRFSLTRNVLTSPPTLLLHASSLNFVSVLLNVPATSKSSHRRERTSTNRSSPPLPVPLPSDIAVTKSVSPGFRVKDGRALFEYQGSPASAGPVAWQSSSASAHTHIACC